MVSTDPSQVNNTNIIPPIDLEEAKAQLEQEKQAFIAEVNSKEDTCITYPQEEPETTEEVQEDKKLSRKERKAKLEALRNKHFKEDREKKKERGSRRNFRLGPAYATTGFKWKDLKELTSIGIKYATESYISKFTVKAYLNSETMTEFLPEPVFYRVNAKMEMIIEDMSFYKDYFVMVNEQIEGFGEKDPHVRGKYLEMFIQIQQELADVCSKFKEGVDMLFEDVSGTITSIMQDNPSTELYSEIKNLVNQNRERVRLESTEYNKILLDQIELAKNKIKRLNDIKEKEEGKHE